MAGSRAPLLCSDVAKKMLGMTIARIDRILYFAKGAIQGGEGPLEIQLNDGSVFLFNGAHDGESLCVAGQAWTDPFDGNMNPENEAFIAESGKWCRVPVSSQAPYNELINATVEAVELLENQFGRAAGLAIETPSRKLWFVIQGDEAVVFWAFPLAYRTSTRYSATPPGGG